MTTDFGPLGVETLVLWEGFASKSFPFKLNVRNLFFEDPLRPIPYFLFCI